MANKVTTAKTQINEGSSQIATVTLSTLPTTLEYRVYNESRSIIVKDWCSLTPVLAVSITVGAGNHNVFGRAVSEAMSLIVAADRSLDTELIMETAYQVKRVAGYDEGDAEVILYLLDQEYNPITDEAGEGIYA